MQPLVWETQVMAAEGTSPCHCTAGHSRPGKALEIQRRDARGVVSTKECAAS